MRSNKPILETSEQFRDAEGNLWCVQTYYPQGKRNGNDRYWLAYINKIGTNETITCAELWHLERELDTIKHGQRELF